jgi:hypothetical protein
MNRKYYIMFALLILLCGVGQPRTFEYSDLNQQKVRGQNSVAQKGDEKMAIVVTSEAFKEAGMIPAMYTCDGKNISPPLQWQQVPQDTKSLALIYDDPDAPMGIWVHWVMWNIPAEANGLPENVPAGKDLPDGSKQGVNDSRKQGYSGPCPPGGTHRYYFKIYALDAKLNLPSASAKQDLLDAMKGHILAEGRLMGKYKRQ